MNRNILVVGFLFILASCGVTTKEEQRVTSPDGKFDAVFIVKSGGGAAGFVDYEVHIVPNGEPVKGNDDRYLLADGAYGLNIEWVEPKLLEITYPSASEIQSFNNVLYVKNEQNTRPYYFIYEIVLKRVDKEKLRAAASAKKNDSIARYALAGDDAGWKRVKISDLKDTVDYSLRKSSENSYLSAKGDFDGNGHEDVVELVSRDHFSTLEYAFRVVMNGDAPQELLLRRGTKADLAKLGVITKAPGEYKTACAKGYGRCSDDAPQSVQIANAGFGLFQFESAEILYHWKDGEFHRLALSD